MQNERMSSAARELIRRRMKQLERPPTQRELQITRNVLNGMSCREAALAAGSQAKSDHTLKVVGQCAVTKVTRQPEFIAMMAEKGLTLETLVEDMKAMRVATMPVNAGGEIIEYPDNKARSQEIDRELKIHGLLVNRTETVTATFEEHLMRLEFSTKEEPSG